MTKIKHAIEFLALFALMVSIIMSAFYLAEYIGTNDATRVLVEKFGILGIIAVAFVGGLNLVVPVPAATFTPLFVAANFSMLTIISALVIGTLLADLLGYQIGKWGKRSTEVHFPKFHNWLVSLKKKHHHLILPGIFLYSAFIPLPNETILIPLGLMGYRYWTIALPLFLGTLVNQLLYAYGFVSIFDHLFLTAL